MTSSKSRTAKRLLLIAAVLVAMTSAAVAGARKRVVVLDFEGPKAERFHDDLVKLLKKTHTVVAADKWNGVAEEMDAAKVNEKNVKKVAKKLKIDAVVTGKIEKRRDEYIIRLKLREGKSGMLVGDGVETKADGPRLDGSASKDIKDELIGAIEQLEANHGGGGGGGEDDADDAKPKKTVKKKGGGDDDDDGADTKAKKTTAKKKGGGDDDDDDGASKHGGFSKKSSAGRSNDDDDADVKAKKTTAKKTPPPPPPDDDDADAKAKKTTAKKQPPPPPDDDADTKAALKTKKTAPPPDDDADAKPKKTAAKKKQTDDETGGDEDAPKRSKKKKVAREEDDDGSVRGGVDVGAPTPAAALSPTNRAIDGTVGASFTGRKLSFTYDPALGNPPPGYSSAPVTGVLVDVTLYPLALGHKRRGIAKDIGFQVVFDRVLFLNSQKQYLNQMSMAETVKLGTTEQRYAFGPVVRFTLGNKAIGFKLLYEHQDFLIAQTLPNDAQSGTTVDIPNVSYSAFTPSAFAAIPLTPKITFNADGGLIIVTGAGADAYYLDNGQLAAGQGGEYGRSKKLGFEIQAGGDYQITRELFVRARVRFEQIGISFAADPSTMANNRDPSNMGTQSVFGAKDLFYGAQVSVGYLF